MLFQNSWATLYLLNKKKAFLLIATGSLLIILHNCATLSKIMKIKE